MKRPVLLLSCLAMLLMALVMLVSQPGVRAQSDPTAQRQTLEAIIYPRLTLTERAREAREGTRAANATPSRTPNATQRVQTLVGNVNLLLTETRLAQTGQAATQSYLATIDRIILQTLGFTATPSPSPTATPPLGTPDATQWNETIVASVNERLTRTAQVQATLQIQQTIEAIVQRTIGFTLTPNATEFHLTIEAFISQSLTQTPEAMLAASATAGFKATVQQVIDQQRTATTYFVRATMVSGLEILTAFNAARVGELYSAIGHQGAVLGAAFASDGARFASAGADTSLRVWEALTGQQALYLPGLSPQQSVALSPDGVRIASGGDDGGVRLRHAQSGEELLVLRGHSGGVLALAFNPDGKLLASASADRTVRVWNAQSGDLLATLSGHRGAVSAVAFSPDGTLLVSGGQDAQVIFWQVSTGGQIRAVRDAQPVHALAFSPVGLILATAGDASLVSLWNVENGQRVGQFRVQPGGINALAFTVDGSALAAGGGNGEVALWDTSGAALTTLRGHTQAISALVISPDGARLLSASTDGTLKAWGVRP